MDDKAKQSGEKNPEVDKTIDQVTEINISNILEALYGDSILGEPIRVKEKVEKIHEI